jgi:hypothetical protein
MNLKKIGKVFTSKFVGTGPSSFEKKNSPCRGLTNVEKHCSKLFLHARCNAGIAVSAVGIPALYYSKEF